MKPLKIVMEAFGPYLVRTEIDLTKFGNNGLYLITGNTGAGKSTIFDAISYALFGNPSGVNKETSMLRCIFAHPENPTYVEMEFEFRKKIYKIKRNPEYIGINKKGDSTKTVKQDAYMEFPDSKILSGYEKVTLAVGELLSLNKEQFSQLVMIAQGDFQKVLFTPTKEKIEVYRQIFRTEKYKRLTDKLEEKNKEIKNIYEHLSKMSNELFNDIYCDQEDVLFVDLEKAKKIQMSSLEKFELIEKIIKKDQESLKLIAQDLLEKNKEKENLTKKITKAETLNKAFEQLHTTEEQIKIEQESFIKIERDFKNLKESENQIKILNEKSAVLNNKMDSYSSLNEKSLKLDSLNTNVAKNKELVLLLNDETEKLKIILINQKKELENLSETEIKLLNLENQVKDFINQKDVLNDLYQAILLRKNYSLELEKAQSIYLEAQKQADLKNEKYRNIKKTFMDNLAGVLASSLKENVPCPVCGSLNHTNPCKVLNEIPSKELVDKAEKDYNESQLKCENDNKKASEIKAKLESLQKEIKQKVEKSELKEDSEVIIFEKLNKIEKLIFEYKENIEKEKLNLSKIEKLKIEIPDLENKIEENNLKINKINLEIQRDESSSKAIFESMLEIKKNLEFESKQIAEEKLLELETEAKNIQFYIEKIRKNYEICSKKISELKGTIQVLKDQTKNNQPINTKNLYLQKDEIEKSISQIEKTNSEINIRISKNNEKYEKIVENQKEIENAEKKFNMINSLFKTAAGNLGNKKLKIQLETYVQMNYLDKVIIFANERLKIMTDNQYELVRKKDDFSFNSFSGLDIDVIDHFNGGIRSVKSLSGGESFQASLALALGLSDIVRHSFSGVTIDTLFIDEGFGTLDSETLQKSFKALLSLTEETDRLIGIISHVDFLKDKIRNHVFVTKTEKSGSTVQIRT